MLTANNFAELADLDVLSTFGVLTHLVLMENPVTRKEVCVRSTLLQMQGVKEEEEELTFGWRSIIGIGFCGDVRVCDSWTTRR